MKIFNLTTLFYFLTGASFIECAPPASVTAQPATAATKSSIFFATLSKASMKFGPTTIPLQGARGKTSTKTIRYPKPTISPVNPCTLSPRSKGCKGYNNGAGNSMTSPGVGTVSLGMTTVVAALYFLA